ncbi:MAG: ATP-binding cassette domain-containing protein, partial [Candidatus Cardinium sp.]|nr:ATP-binding cassette domain-containing protein [Candidatus Cardinium sp.]
MQTQERASKRKAYGEKKYAADKLALRAAQGSGQNSCSKKKAKIRENKEALFNQLASLRQPALIKPKFFIANHEVARRSVVQISGGLVGYCLDQPLLSDINLTLSGQDRLALAGDNGSGKSTLIKAILGDKSVYKTGEWYVVKREDMGYLDQHYSTLSPSKSVLETISTLVPDWSHAEVRRHLNDFLFRNNEE